MDIPKQLQFLVEQTLSGQYQPGEKFACQQFIAT